MSDEVLEVQQRTFPKSVQPGLPRLQSPKPGWNTYRFGELLKAVQRPVKLRSDEAYDLVTVKRSRGGIEARGKLRGSQISVKSQFRIEKDDFLISKRQIVHGACGVVTAAFDGSIVSNEYSVLLCKPSLDLNFLGYLTHSVYFQQTCFHSSIGVHIEKMIFKLDDWLKWPINIPSRPEQQKIAAFLGAVDAKLAALASRQVALGRFKAGLMQKLFSQQLRFTRDDGQAFPDWVEKRLGELGSFKSGVGFSEVEQGGMDGIPLYKVSDMNLAGNEHRMVRANNYVTLDQIERLKYRPICPPSLIFAKVGAAIFLERKRRAENFLLDNNMMAFTPNASISIEFSVYLFSITRLSKFAQVGALPSFNAGDVAALKVSVPRPDEQQKIANALSAMDAKIQAVADQVTKLQTFKKGLLQQMFV